MQNIEENNRFLFADVIRAYAIVLIVLIHVSAPITAQFLNIEPKWWWIGNIFTSFAKHSVPLFIMISGMLLLDPRKTESIAMFFRKRFKKLFPFFGWGIIYFYWRSFNGEHITITHAITEFIQGPIYFHFWFIYMIVGLYLITPVLRVYVRYADNANLYFFITLWFSYLTIQLLLKSLFDLQLWIELPFATGYVGYFVLGYALRDVSININQIKIFCLLILGMVISTAIGTFFLSVGADAMNKILYTYIFPNIIVISTLVFLVLKSINYDGILIKMPYMKKIIAMLSRNAFGIYLAHVLIIEILTSGLLGLKITNSTVNPLIGIPVTTVTTLIISLIIIQLLSKMPFIKSVIYS